MQSSQTEKQSVRSLLRQKRRELEDGYIKESSESICRHVIDYITSHKPDCVCLFAPLGKEPDVLPLAKSLTDKGINIAFPISQAEDIRLDFRFITDISDLTAGTYGIREPSTDAPQATFTERSLCIVPALAFDKSGMRMGYGKGYYDRFLAEFSGTSVGVVYSKMLTDTLPTDMYDVPVSIIITERGVISVNEVTKKR